MSTFIVSAYRSAVAPKGGNFAGLEPHEIAAPVIQKLLDSAGLEPHFVNEIIVSSALGKGGNPARLVALAAGLPEAVAGLSIDRQCAGGMDAILLARQMILSGEADVVIAGGVESYSRQPLRHLTFADGRPPELYDQAPFTPWPDRDPKMAEAAAALATAKGISRAAQDAWAMDSHQKAAAAAPSLTEIMPVAGLAADPFTRNLSAKLCQRAKILSGDVTTANTAVAADAAAFCLVVSAPVAARLSLPAVRIVGGRTMGGDPTCPGIAPVAAAQQVLMRAGLAADRLTCAEIMEAYAVQAIACVEGAGIDPRIVNQGGGALARGHPIGASGAINIVRLYHTLTRQGPGFGLGAIAAAGGIGTALLLEA